MKNRRGWAILAVISLAPSVAMFLICLHLISVNKHTTCQLLGVIVSKQVRAPATPYLTPEKEANYLRHVRYERLNKRCQK